MEGQCNLFSLPMRFIMSVVEGLGADVALLSFDYVHDMLQITL